MPSVRLDRDSEDGRRGRSEAFALIAAFLGERHRDGFYNTERHEELGDVPPAGASSRSAAKTPTVLPEPQP